MMFSTKWGLTFNMTGSAAVAGMDMQQRLAVGEVVLSVINGSSYLS